MFMNMQSIFIAAELALNCGIVHSKQDNNKTRIKRTQQSCDMKRNNSMTERMNKNEPPKY